jgi:hypothetical protein
MRLKTVGRPSLPKKPISVSFDLETLSKLKLRARQCGRSISGHLRFLVNQDNPARVK